MLSENAQIRILKASAGIGICSKCRWSPGCLECSGQHSFKYYMNKEALSKSKVASYTGHGGGGGITYHHHHHHHHHPPSCIIIIIHIHSFLSLLLLLMLLLLLLKLLKTCKPAAKINENDQVFNDTGRKVNKVFMPNCMEKINIF